MTRIPAQWQISDCRVCRACRWSCRGQEGTSYIERFKGDSLAEGHGCYPSRLRATDLAHASAQQVLTHLRRFLCNATHDNRVVSEKKATRSCKRATHNKDKEGSAYTATGVAGDESDLVVPHGVDDLLAVLGNRQAGPLALDLECLGEL